MATPNLNLPTLPGGATDASVAYNQAMQLLDSIAQLSIVAITPTPPTTTGADVGKSWIIADAATGIWAGKDGQLALCTAADVWAYFQPQDGWRAGTAGGLDYRYDAAGNDWVSLSPLTNPMTTPGDLIVGGVDGVPARLAVGTNGHVLRVVGGVPTYTDESAAAGDVVGPAGSTNLRIAVFGDATGKLLADGGKTIAEVLAPAVQSVVSAATVTPTFDNDVVEVTAQAAALQFLNVTGTAVNGKAILFRVKDNGTARALTWDTDYVGVGGALPTTTVAGKWMYFSGFYSVADDKVHVVLPAAVQP